MKNILTNKWTWIILAVVVIGYLTRDKWMPLLGMGTDASARFNCPPIQGLDCKCYKTAVIGQGLSSADAIKACTAPTGV